jgi:hypothetical protein
MGVLLFNLLELDIYKTIIRNYVMRCIFIYLLETIISIP